MIFVERDDRGYLYAYGTDEIIWCMRKNSFRKIERLRDELKRAYKKRIAELQEDIVNINEIAEDYK